MHYPPIPQRKSCNCEDPCISTDDIYYAGPNLPNSGVNTNDLLTEVIERLDAVYAVPTLQRVTEINNLTTLPINADSFVKIGGDGTNILLDDGTVLPIGELPVGVTETSQLLNDGEDGINPFITALDIPVFNPSNYDLDEFTNIGIDPFAKISDIPAPLGYTPVNKAGDTMLGSLILHADPSIALQAATKQYVDNIAGGITFKSPVLVATTGNLNATYDNGVLGVGATLTSNVDGVIEIDQEFPGVLERILVWQQADAVENGIYEVTDIGSLTTPFILTRTADADNTPAGELAFGDYTFVLSGDINSGRGFICNTSTTIVIGVTPISFVQFNTAQVTTPGYGLQEGASPGIIEINPLETQEKIGPTTTGVTQSASNNSTLLATTEYVDRQISLTEPVSNILIVSSVDITTETPGVYGGDDYSQNGRNVMINNSSPITITATSASNNFIASYTKLVSSSITFVFTGGTLIAPLGDVLNGNPGSTALLTKNGSTVYLLINNI